MTACAVALVLLLDVSGSIDAAAWRLQVEGHAEALTAPAVVRQVEREGVAVALVQFDHGARLVLPWRVLRAQVAAEGQDREPTGLEYRGG